MVQQIMLALHCKKTDAVDLKSPIWEYITNTYSVEQVKADSKCWDYCVVANSHARYANIQCPIAVLSRHQVIAPGASMRFAGCNSASYAILMCLSAGQ